MRVPEYLDALRGPGKQAVVHDPLFPDDPIVLDAPNPGDPEIGPDIGQEITARAAVELHRALTAWLRDHKSLHPRWHRDYRDGDPGGWK
jgi:hypothetical protein